VAKPPFQYTPTADPNWVIRCAYNPISKQYDQDCQRIPASEVPMGTSAIKTKAKFNKKTAKKKKAKKKKAAKKTKVKSTKTTRRHR
jgi:hypothetical protein